MEHYSVLTDRSINMDEPQKKVCHVRHEHKKVTHCDFIYMKFLDKDKILELEIRSILELEQCVSQGGTKGSFGGVT